MFVSSIEPYRVDLSTIHLDDAIRPLIEQLNESPYIATTNCCAGHFRWCKGYARKWYVDDIDFSTMDDDSLVCSRCTYPYVQFVCTIEAKPFVDFLVEKGHGSYNTRSKEWCFGIPEDRIKHPRQRLKMFAFWKDVSDAWKTLSDKPPKIPTDLPFSELDSCIRGNRSIIDNYVRKPYTLYDIDLYGDDHQATHWHVVDLADIEHPKLPDDGETLSGVKLIEFQRKLAERIREFDKE